MRIIAVLLFLFCVPMVEAAQPNILFLFADDQSYDTLGPNDDPQVQTPHLDQLARRGVQFTHCYNMGSWQGAVCVASRTMLNTGSTLWRALKADGQLRMIRRKKSSVDSSQLGFMWGPRMKQLGYETYFTGKWHVQADTTRLFDHVRHERPGMPADTRKPPYHEEGYHRPVQGQPDKWSPFDKKFGGFWEGGRHWSEVLADDAITFLKDAGTKASQPGAKPFFMYLAFNAPHDPRQSPQEFVEKYPLASVKLPAPFYARHPYDTAGLTPSRRDESLAPYPRTKYAVKVNRQEYYAIITHLDQQIGRVLAELKKQGLDDNTWIIYSADHGLSCGHHGLMGKQNMYDHSLRAPFIIVGPNVKPNTQSGEPIYVQDLMATCLDLAGDSKRQGIEFQSLLPILKGGKSRYQSIYGAFMNTQRAVIHDGWKLILYPELKVQLLYHLQEDPQELKNLAEEASQLPRMQSLFAELQRLQKEHDDEVDLAAVYPRLVQ